MIYSLLAKFTVYFFHKIKSRVYKLLIYVINYSKLEYYVWIHTYAIRYVIVIIIYVLGFRKQTKQERNWWHFEV